MLLNLSNHPVATWSDRQKETALQQFGEVVDMTFPAIPPTASNSELQELAQRYWVAVKNQNPQAVHLMGELTFCFALASLLQKSEILCLVSTSNRNSMLNPDGTKTVSFDFVQFRAYPNLTE